MSLSTAEGLDTGRTDLRQVVDVEQQREQLQVDQVASTVVVTTAVERVGAGVDLLCDLVAQRQAVDRSVRVESDRAVLRWRDAVVFIARAPSARLSSTGTVANGLPQ